MKDLTRISFIIFRASFKLPIKKRYKIYYHKKYKNKILKTSFFKMNCEKSDIDCENCEKAYILG